jgi:hypothetical protein
VNLSGWFLTDDETMPQKWAFPAVTLNAGQFLVVFASGKDRAVVGQELHTNFSLEENGGYLALAQPGGAASRRCSTCIRTSTRISATGIRGRSRTRI